MMLDDRPLIPRLILDRFALGERNGRFAATILFADISGFTPLTETLFQYQRRGAEILSNLLDETFGEMVQAVHQQRGIIPTFEGDGFFAIFPESETETAINHAWQTAVFIQHIFKSVRGTVGLFATPYGVFEISMKVGITQGEVHWGIITTAQEATYYFRGEAFTRCGLAEKLAQPGDIIVESNLLSSLPPTLSATPVPDMPYHKITQYPPPDSPPQPPPFIKPNRSELTPFIPQSILDLATPAEFRYVSPAFISFQAENENWPVFIQQVLNLTQQYSGTFNRISFGDKGGMIALWFGAPVSHENSVARAAACLLALRKIAIIPWRAGLTYGLVWAGFRGGQQRSEYGCLGDAVNTAARIMMLAAWGEIWLNSTAAHEVQARYLLNDLGQFQVRGKEFPQQLYRLDEPRLILNVLYQGQMIGRQAELAQLQENIAPIFNGRSAPPALISGEAGIGKSRLVFALQEQLGPRVRWYTCPTDDILHLSLNPFRTLLKSWFRQSTDHTSTQNQQQFEQQFDQLLTLVSNDDERATAVYNELQRTRTLLANLINLSLPDPFWSRLDPKLRFENTLLALTAFLRALVWHQPTILLLEDIHWLDDDSQQFIQTLPRLLADYPVALILTSRQRTNNHQFLAHNLTLSPLIIDLNTFSTDNLQQLCQQLLHAPVSAQVIQFLQEKSGGNPFFAEQLLLELSEQELLIPNEQAQLKLQNNPQDLIPTHLDALLIARLDRLPAEVKEVVQTAAILGQRFALPVLAALLQDDTHWSNKVQEAANKQIWAMLDELHYLFKHALLREAAYKMQLKSRLRQLHHHIALILEQNILPDTPPPYGEIAHHYEAAYKLGLADVQMQAITYLQKAGQQSAAAFENETAVTYFSRALALTPVADYATRLSLLFGREAIYRRLGQRDAQLNDLTQLENLTQSQQLIPDQLEVTLRQAMMGEETNDLKTALPAAQTAISLAQTIGDNGQEAAGYYWLGRIHWQQLDFENAIDNLQKAYQQAKQAKRHDIETKSLRSLAALASIAKWDFAHSNTYGQKAVTIARKIGDKEGESLALNNLGMNAQFLGYYAKATSYYEQALTIARQIGSRHAEGMVLNSLGDVLTIQEQFTPALQFYEEALHITQEIENPISEGYSWMGLGEVWAELGRFEEAITAVKQAIKLRRSQGNQTQLHEYQINLATIYLHSGNASQAAAELSEPLTYLAAGGNFHRTLYGFRNHLRCYHILKAVDDPRALAFLDEMFTQLQKSSLRLQEKSFRSAYLDNVPWHREITQLYHS